ncbi:MAG: SDR family oxidoreductase [Dehalococcoidia bacterium]
MLTEFSLEGRVALVTGASRGIGQAIAETLAEAGSDIIAAGRDLTALGKTRDLVEGKGRKCHVVRVDVCSQAEIESLVAEGLGTFGHLDILVNNAGIDLIGPVVYHEDLLIELTRKEALSLEEWEKVLRTNLTSMFLTCKALGPHMMERRSGKVINISSIQGVGSLGGLAIGDPAYGTSKAGIMYFTKALALEWAPFNINVNSLSPGCFWTEMWETPGVADEPQARQEIIDAMTEYIPLRRWGNLRELGLLAVYMASSASDYLTGQVIHLDGGFVAK